MVSGTVGSRQPPPNWFAILYWRPATRSPSSYHARRLVSGGLWSRQSLPYSSSSASLFCQPNTIATLPSRLAARISLCDLHSVILDDSRSRNSKARENLGSVRGPSKSHTSAPLRLYLSTISLLRVEPSTLMTTRF